MAAEVLPDSRLFSDRGGVMVDWPLPGGGHTRIEVIPVFCANCGEPHGFVPKENTHWAFWLCNTCWRVWGAIAGTYAEPDAVFWEKVNQQMIESFGRPLDQIELQRLAEQGWGPLAKLVKDSPIKART